MSPSVVASETETPVLLGERLFKDILLRERRRAERFGHSFAVLVCDRERHSMEPCAWAPVLAAVAHVQGGADLAGWLETGSVLALLVPETSDDATLATAEHLERQIAAMSPSDAGASISVRSYFTGGAPGPKVGALPSVDALIEAFVERRARRRDDIAKRCLDVAGSAALLLFLAPVFLAVALGVKWSSPGPVLFRQTRVGRRGEHFTMLKFRSMRADTDHAIHQDYVSWFIKSSGKQQRTGDEVFKITTDPRVTPFGRFIRKTSLDELPQFWNVIRGDMSLVGPRPPLPFEVEQYQPWHKRRVLDAAPGITGLWQVTGRSRTTFDEMVRLDLRYAMTRTIWMDIKILAATPRAVISGKGAC